MKMKQTLDNDVSARLVHIHKTAPDSYPRGLGYVDTLCYRTVAPDAIVEPRTKPATCKLCIATLLSRITVLEGAKPPTQDGKATLAFMLSRLRNLLP